MVLVEVYIGTTAYKSNFTFILKVNINYAMIQQFSSEVHILEKLLNNSQMLAVTFYSERSEIIPMLIKWRLDLLFIFKKCYLKFIYLF